MKNIVSMNAQGSSLNHGFQQRSFIFNHRPMFNPHNSVLKSFSQAVAHLLNDQVLMDPFFSFAFFIYKYILALNVCVYILYVFLNKNKTKDFYLILTHMLYK